MKPIDFVSQSKYALIIAIVCCVISCASLAVRGLNYGIDFLGGVLIEVAVPEGAPEQTIDMAHIRSTLGKLNFGEVNLQALGTEKKEMMIHVLAESQNEQSAAATVQKIKQALADQNLDYRRVEVVGPKIGDELARQSLIASLIALAAIALYIWIRFEWQFAVMCLITVAFDLFVTVGFFSVTGMDWNMTVVAGLLSLAGYTTNDKVVNFDRVRENLKLFRKWSLKDILNKSLNTTLSRTLLTSITTMLVLVALLILGGQTLRGFSVCLLFGVAIGTLSSLYIAVPMLRFFDIRNVGTTDNVNPFFEAAQKEAKK